MTDQQWAPDPTGRYPHRLHDGTAWSDRVAVDGQVFSDAEGGQMARGEIGAQQASDGKWYPVRERKPVSRQTWIAFGIIGAFLVGLVVISLIVSSLSPDEPDTPTVEERTGTLLELAWSRLDGSEQMQLCAEVRASGVDAAVSALQTETDVPMDSDAVRYWLEDRCGD